MGKVAVGGTPEALWESLRRDWLVVGCLDKERADGEVSFEVVGDEWFELVARRREQLEWYASEHEIEATSALMVLIADADPLSFLAGVWAALLAGWNIALANAHWGLQEWQSVGDLIKPQVIWNSIWPSPQKQHSCPLVANCVSAYPPYSTLAQPAILIPTGGTSGHIKFAHHTWQTLVISVLGFHQHFFLSQSPINSYCVLPLYHVSGLLQVLRSALTNGQLILAPFKPLLIPRFPQDQRYTVHDQQTAFPHSPFPQVAATHSPPAANCVSLVPTQLSRLLDANKAAWLSQFHAVLLGGAPPWPSLLENAIARKISLCLSYGMTETAAMVSATHPPDFLQTDPTRQSLLGSGHAMPHAEITVERAGLAVATGDVGQVVVRSGAIALGYYNAPSPNFAPNTFYTDDLGYLDAEGRLHITGRASGKIISGGENIFPAEVEAALRSTGQVRDVCVVGLPHPIWGEAVSAAYVPTDETVSPESLKAALVENAIDSSEKSVTPALSRYKVPKHWFPLPCLPRNAQGKINRSVLLSQLETLSNQPAQGVMADDDGSEG